jgi:hypothetical protein
VWGGALVKKKGKQTNCCGQLDEIIIMFVLLVLEPRLKCKLI